MSAFKDAVRKDVDNVFLDTDTFAEMHHLGQAGACVPCLIDTDVVQGGINMEGVFENVLTVYVNYDDLPEVPAVGSLFRIDGSYHTVRSSRVEDGMVVVVCGANGQ